MAPPSEPAGPKSRHDASGFAQGRREAAPPPAVLFDVTERSIEDLQQAMQAGQVTSKQLVESYLARIEAYDKRGPALNAITVVNPEARAAAAALDAERARGRARGPLHGIPVLVKDNYETIEMPTSAGSIALATFHPKRDAHLVSRLKDAGAVILGKTNMHELAAGITTVGSRFGQTRNPYDLDRNPGGSSGGTGAAIAANFAAGGMGSDTCGSIRNPASQNNLVGLRGTRGLSSRRGIVPLSSTQDIGGPIARSMTDLAILLDATVGQDPADVQTRSAEGRIPKSFRAELRSEALKGARIGVLRSVFGTTSEDQEVTRIVQTLIDALKKAGAEIPDVSVPGLDDLNRDSSLINAEFKFDLADYLATAEDPPVKSLGEILERGLYHQALESSFRTRNAVERRDTDAARRSRVKQLALRSAFEAVLDEHRLVALLYPTLRRKPARIGEAQTGSTCGLSSHSGLPALAIPAGFSDDGLPIGVELLGAPFTESELLSLGFSIEQLMQLRRPPFSTPALVNGKAPAARTMNAPLAGGSVQDSNPSTTPMLQLTYDATTAELRYSANGAGVEAVAAVWIHAGTVEKPAAARHLLLSPGQPPTGRIVLSFGDRRDLDQGRLLLRVYERGRAGSARDVPIRFDR